MPAVLIIGATRGLGLSLANLYASIPDTNVYGTTRSAAGPAPKDESSPPINKSIVWVPHIDLMSPSCGASLVNQLGMLGVGNGMVERGVKGFDVVIITAGYFATEDFTTGPKWDDAVKMYTTSSVSPPALIFALHRASLLPKGSKIILISSESGSIALRHPKEGGGNYAHHASKAALNMVGKLLSMDLKEYGIIVSIVHPGFMRTDMTKGVGFDKYYDDGGAVTPDVAAGSMKEWVEGLVIEKSGEYWAPRGPRDIGTAEPVMGTGLATPLQLPW